MPAAYAADGRSDPLYRLFKAMRKADHLAGAVVEHGSDISSGLSVFFSPKVEREGAVARAKEQSRSDLWTRPSRVTRQGMERDGQFAGVEHAQHLDPNQTLRNKDGVPPVDRDGVDSLQPS
jgi:hypothetical protein